MSPFAPIGDTARWKVMYGLLRTKAIGDLITFEEMAEALELDPVRDRQTLRVAFRDAARRFEEDEKRAVDAVRGVGYVVVDAVAQLGLARRHGRKAGRQLQRAYSKAVNVDLSGESPAVRAAFETVATAFAYQMEINRRQASKTARMQKTLDDLRTETRNHSEATDRRLADIERRMRAMGIAPDEDAAA
jgi:hypothetical protein